MDDSKPSVTPPPTGLVLAIFIILLASAALVAMIYLPARAPRTEGQHHMIEVTRIIEDHRQITCYPTTGGTLSCDRENASPPIYK